MNALLPIGLLAGAFIISQSGKKSKPASTSTKTPKLPKPTYLSEDCQWICGEVGFGGLNVAKEVFEKQSLYAPFIEKHGSDKNAIALVSTEILVKEMGKCKITLEKALQLDVMSARYRYANSYMISAFFLALSGKMSSQELAMWLNIEYPNVLRNLGMLQVGNFEQGVMQARFASITDAVIESIIQKTFILTPEFRNLSAELLATMFIVQFSQIVDITTKNDCYKVNKALFADFSSLSGKLDPFLSSQWKRFYDAVVILNPKS